MLLAGAPRALVVPSGHNHHTATKASRARYPHVYKFPLTNEIVFRMLWPVAKEHEYIFKDWLGIHIGETSCGPRSPTTIAFVSPRVIYADFNTWWQQAQATLAPVPDSLLSVRMCEYLCHGRLCRSFGEVCGRMVFGIDLGPFYRQRATGSCGHHHWT